MSLAAVLLKNQVPDGGWQLEASRHGDARFGRTHTNGLAVLLLTAQNELLPVFRW